jgi:predicted nucleic acid-binding protein
VGEFYTCAITELGFLRISLSIAYQAPWTAAHEALEKLHARLGYRFLADDVDGTASPQTNSQDTTDAHLVCLAKRHGIKLATLDGTLIAKSWAAGVADNPLARPAKSD